MSESFYLIVFQSSGHRTFSLKKNKTNQTNKKPQTTKKTQNNNEKIITFHLHCSIFQNIYCYIIISHNTLCSVAMVVWFFCITYTTATKLHLTPGQNLPIPGAS